MPYRSAVVFDQSLGNDSFSERAIASRISGSEDHKEVAAATLEVLWRPCPRLGVVFMSQNQDSLAPAFLVKCFTVQVSKPLFSKQSQRLSWDFAVRGCDVSGTHPAGHCSAWYLCSRLWCRSPARCHRCSLQHLPLSRCHSNGSGSSLHCTRRGKRVLRTSQETILCTLCQCSGNFVQSCCLLRI